jgi:hypothetical protein
MDDFDPEKGYVKLLGVPDTISQAREFTQVQSLFDHRIRELASTLYKDGQVLEGCFITVSEDKKFVEISPGKIYAEGFIISFNETSKISIQGYGTEIVGVVKEEEIITEKDDPSLLDPHAGFSNYNEVGSHRLKQRWFWNVISDTGYGIFVLTDGVLPGETIDKEKAINPQPKAETQNVLDIIAKRDFDKSGNFVLSGLKLKIIEHPDYPWDKRQLIIEAGTARIQGYDVSLIKDYAMDLELARETDEILDEPWLFEPYDTVTGTGGIYLLGEKPVAKINRVSATVLAVDGYGDRDPITRGQIPGGKDELSESSVEAVLAVSQQGTWDPNTESFVGVNQKTFSKSSYLVDGNDLDWSPTGDEPAPGSSYMAAYKYRKQLKKQIMEARDVQKELVIHDDSGDQLAFEGKTDRFVCEDNKYTSFRVLVNFSTVEGAPAGIPGVDFTADFVRDTDFALDSEGKIDWYDYEIVVKQITKGSLNSIDNFSGIPVGYETHEILDVVYYDDPNNQSFDEATKQFINPSVRYTHNTDFNWTSGVNQIDWSPGSGANEPPTGATYFVALKARKYKSENHPGYGEPYYVCYWYWDIMVAGDYLARDSFFVAWDGDNAPENIPQHFGLELETMISFSRAYNYRHRVGHLDSPYPDSLVEVDYEYYLPRYVLVEFNKLDPVKLIYGNSSLKPTEPVYDVIDTAILIGKIYCEADSLNMQLTQMGVRTLKVVDLHNMRDRIVRTEQNLAQTWLDLDAKSFPIEQKKGILTTSFSNNDRIDKGWSGVTYSIDPDWEQLALPHDDSFYTLELDQNSTTAKICDRICLMEPDSEETIEQPFHTTDESIAPYALAGQGTLEQAQNVYMKIKPAGDTVIIPRNLTFSETATSTDQNQVVETLVNVKIAPWGWSGIHSQKAVVFNDKMYLIGGQGDFSKGFESFDFKRNAWTREPSLPLGDAITLGLMGSTGTSAVLYNNRVYLWSGISGGTGVVNVMEIYDFNTGIWYTVNHADTAARVDHVSVVYNDKMYVVGGFFSSELMDATSHVDVYDFATGLWSQQTIDFPNKLTMHGAAVFNNKIYVLGTYQQASSFSVYLLIHSAGVWTVQLVGTSGATWPIGTTATDGLVGRAAYYEGKMYILYNTQPASSNNYFYALDLTNYSWTQLPNPNNGDPRSACSSVVYDKKIYFFGGICKLHGSNSEFLIFDLVANQWLDPTLLRTNVLKTIESSASSTLIPSGAAVTVGSSTVTGVKTMEEAMAWAMSDIAKLSNPSRWFSKGWTGGTEQRVVTVADEGGIQHVTTASSKQNEVFTSEYMRDIQGNCRQLEVTFDIPGGLMKPDVMDLEFFMYFGSSKVDVVPLDDTPSGSLPGSFKAKPNGSAKGTFLIPAGIPEGRIEVKAVSNPVIINDKEWRQTVVAIYDAAVVEKVTMVFERCRCNCWCHCVCNCWNCRGRCGTGPLAETLEPVGKQRVLKQFMIDFTQVHPDYGVFGCIINTDNGNPTSSTVSSGMIARKFLTADEMAGAGKKYFVLDDPLFLDDKAYAIVVTGEDGWNINSIAEIAAGKDIRCKIATLGQQDLKSGKTVGSQPFKNGNLFKSLTGVTWEIDQKSDLTFNATFYLFPTTKENIVYLKPTVVNNATAFICQWNSQVPDGTKIIFEYRTQNGKWTEFTPYQLTHLTEVATTLYFRARLSTSTANICPFVEQFAGLMTQSTKTNLKVVTRSFDVDPADVLNIWIDSHLPSGCSQLLRVTFDNGETWTTLASPVDGLPFGNLVEIELLNANSGQEFYRYHWTVDLDSPQKFTAFRIEVTGTSTGTNAELKNPRFARLVSIASLA